MFMFNLRKTRRQKKAQKLKTSKNAVDMKKERPVNGDVVHSQVSSEETPLIPPTSPTVRADSSMASTKEPPSLARAWAYFEHHMLPRYIVMDDDDDDDDDVPDTHDADPMPESGPALAPRSRSRSRSRPYGHPINFVTEDLRSSMTRGRKLALYLSKYSWYNKGKQLTPEEMGSSQEEERRNVGVKKKGRKENKYKYKSDNTYLLPDKKFQSAPPGENMHETRLYPVHDTTLSQMGDFGLGVGLYFVTLHAFLYITLLCGCISIYNMHYFASDAYNGPDGENGTNFDGSPSIPWYLKGSAVCARHEWVLCPSCTREDFEKDAQYRISIADDGTVFALKNQCAGTIFKVGMVTLSTIIIATLGLIATYYWLKFMEVKFDEDEQTAQDYSIIIRNPPNINTMNMNNNDVHGNIHDPRVWSNFFETKFPGSHVTCSTVVVDNDKLLQALLKRRDIIKCLDDALELIDAEQYKMLDLGNLHEEGADDTDDGPDNNNNINLLDLVLLLKDGIDVKMDELKKVVEHMEQKRDFAHQFVATNVSIVFAAIPELYYQLAGIPELYHQLVNIESHIVNLATKHKYPVSSVILTFETETYQRRVLEKMAVSKSLLNRSKIYDVGDSLGLTSSSSSYPHYPHPELLFQGKHILNVQEPAEPSTIRWMDQDTSTLNDIFKILLTFAVLALVVTPIFVILFLKHKFGLEIDLTIVSWYIAGSNACFPDIAKFICLNEKHKNEEQREISLLIKIGVFRIVNSVLLVEAIQSYTNTIMYGEKFLLDGVYKIFFADIVTSTAVQYLDPVPNFQRHFMAPRAKTQEKMNLAMRGGKIFLAERYANICKLFLMAVWYAPIYPAVLFMCSVGLMILSVVDKFSIMRSWRPAPKIGRSIGRVTRQILFPVIVAVMAFQGYRSWSNFPYDRLCETGHNATMIGGLGTGTTTAATVSYNIPMDENIMHISDTTNLVVEVGASTPTYRICNHREEWVDEGRQTVDEQGRLNHIYEWAFVILEALAASIMLLVIINFIERYWRSSYEQIGGDQHKPYGKEKFITAYIPQWKAETSAFPFLVCPTDEIEECGLFNWEDPDRKYGFYDVTKDARKILEDAGIDVNWNVNEDDDKNDGSVDLSKVFSQMVHTPYEYTKDEV